MPKRNRRLLLLVAIAAGAAACGPPDGHPPPGKLTVSFVASPANVANLTLSSASLMIDRIMPIGNAPPPGPPPPTHLTIDALSATGASISFDRLPPGLYSRVQFSVDAVMAQGSWRGTPFSALVGMFGGNQIDLRAATGVALDAGQDATLTVAIDVGSWFGGNVLDGATPSGGQILCDMQNNPATTAQLSMRVNSSFSLQ